MMSRNRVLLLESERLKPEGGPGMNHDHVEIGKFITFADRSTKLFIVILSNRLQACFCKANRVPEYEFSKFTNTKSIFVMNFFFQMKS